MKHSAKLCRAKPRLWIHVARSRHMNPYPFLAAFDVTTDYTVKHHEEFEHGR
jgi:hypothetical protein